MWKQEYNGGVNGDRKDWGYRIKGKGGENYKDVEGGGGMCTFRGREEDFLKYIISIFKNTEKDHQDKRNYQESINWYIGVHLK